MAHDELAKNASTALGINAWSQSGGIAGRGVLLDWLHWRRTVHPELPDLSPVERHEISISDLEEVVKFQKTTLKTGDILFVRSGFVEWHNNATSEERRAGTAGKGTYLGIEATPEAVEWFWNHHFSAVAGDAVAFEACPLGEMDLPSWKTREYALSSSIIGCAEDHDCDLSWC